MDEPINGCQCHGLIGEDFPPFAKGLVGGDQDGAPFVSSADQLEEHSGFGLVFCDVSKVVEYQEMVFVQLCKSAFKLQFAPGDLEFLHEVSCSCKQDAPAIFDQGKTESGR